jgi:hypothetical protein
MAPKKKKEVCYAIQTDSCDVLKCRTCNHNDTNARVILNCLKKKRKSRERFELLIVTNV